MEFYFLNNNGLLHFISMHPVEDLGNSSGGCALKSHWKFQGELGGGSEPGKLQGRGHLGLNSGGQRYYFA